jgi:hypothetical protein
MADFLVSTILLIAAASGWGLGWVFLLRSRGNRKANLQFAALLLLFSLSVFSNFLVQAGLLFPYREKYFVPLWYTLSLGPTLFFFVKFTLYPAYQFRWTDGKHFFLPLAQAAFYWWLYFSGKETQAWVWQHFLAPFFKTFEGVLYVFFFFLYLSLAYRYVKYKQAVVRRKGHFWEYSKTVWLQWTIKFLFGLTVVNTSYIAMDFFVYNFLGWNLYSVRGFSWLGDLSFAAMLLWLVIRGAQFAYTSAYPTETQLRVFESENEWTREGLPAWMEREKPYLDPDLNLRRLGFLCRLRPGKLRRRIREETGKSFEAFICEKRLETYHDWKQDPKYRRQSPDAIGLQAGFPSGAALRKALSSKFPGASS